MWSSGPPRGVWGASQPKLASSDWLVARMNKVGLDGSICAEYICSLIELYPSSKSDRDAAIAEFLMDSVTSSSTLRTSSEQSRFVDETVFELQTRLGDSKTVPQRAPVTVSAEPSIAASVESASAPKKGFKKGVKLSGSALKQVVGNVRPSFVQKYSDDENPSVAPPPVPVSRFVSTRSTDQPVQSSESSFPSLETPQRSTTNSSVTKRNKNKAREIGPDEDWSDTHPEVEAPTPWKTPMTSRPSPPEDNPRRVTASKLVLTSSVVIHAEPEVENVAPLAIDIPEPVQETQATFSPPVVAQVTPTVLLSPQSLLMNIPTDILSFDFRFEGDEEGSTPPRVEPVEPEQKSPEPFDLLKQMFSQSGFTTTLSTASSVPAREDVPAGNSERTYSVAFLLSVLKQMKSSQGGDIPTPIELQGLTQRELSPVARPKTDVSGWRSNDRTSPNTPESHNGSWRASGYTQKGNHKRSQPTVPVTEEGFW